jgi:DNA-binding MarR family transcriptional regulator
VTADTESPCLAGTKPPVGVQADLGWALATVLRAYVRAADCALAGLPGGPRGYRLLSSVARDCPRSQLVLANHVGLDRTIVTYLLDDLAAAGLVERQADPADRRTRRVVATAAGMKALGEFTAKLEHTERRLLSALGNEEAHVLRDLLQRVAVRVNGVDDEALSCG